MRTRLRRYSRKSHIPACPASLSRVVDFVSPERAKDLVRKEPVVFAEVMGEAMGEQSLEVHVMRPAGDGLYEMERDDTGPVPGETVDALVARIAAAHSCRYATVYPAEDRWPPPWASVRHDDGRTGSDR